MNTPSSATKAEDDYFANHKHGVKWPFTIYHKPIEESMAQALKGAHARAAFENRAAEILVFGCGLFHEARLFPAGCRITLVDSDPRLLEFHQGRPQIADIFICSSVSELLEKVQGKFDLIIGKEVIEHIIESLDYLRAFHLLLQPKGVLWLSTPNYGNWPLPVIEKTFLEFVAYCQGFSRKHIHPNKFSDTKLDHELRCAGFSELRLEKTPLSLALIAEARKF